VLPSEKAAADDSCPSEKTQKVSRRITIITTHVHITILRRYSLLSLTTSTKRAESEEEEIDVDAIGRRMCESIGKPGKLNEVTIRALLEGSGDKRRLVSLCIECSVCAVTRRYQAQTVLEQRAKWTRRSSTI